MAWQDRVRKGAYTSPSGARVEFDCVSVSRRTGKRTTAFEFNGVDGAYVQDNGYGARVYALRCLFSGSEHDRASTTFELALLERGEGRLEHPFYGTFNVVPHGEISRRDDLVSEANQSVVEATFWTTIGALYPSNQRNPTSEIMDSLASFGDAAAEQYSDAVALATRSAKESTKTTVQSLLSGINAALAEVARATPSVSREFNDALQTVDVGLAVLVDHPADMARNIVTTTELPATSAAAITDRLDAYGDLASGIFNSRAGRPADAFGGLTTLPRRRALVQNDFRAADLGAMSAVAGSVRSVLATTFETKPQAIEAAETVIAQFEALVAWRDGAFAFLGTVDVGNSYGALQSAVALAAGYLVEVSFSLLPERRVVLDRPRAVIELCAELYGVVDEKLDFFISSNDLSGSEILELPAGKSVVFYV